MRLAAALLAAVVVAGCMGDEVEEERPAAETELVVYVWSRGREGPGSSWTLRCPSTTGNDREARACQRLEAVGPKVFEPVPKDVACVEIYGGPAVADVEGTLDGKPVSAQFNRTDGCEIARWNRARFLFPPS